MRMTAIAAMAGLGLAACAGQTASTTADKAQPVADARFDYAANFTCEGGEKLDVLFHQGNDGSSLARIDGGPALTLAMDPDATTGPTWKNETATLVVNGPGATWTSGGATKPCTFESRSLPPPKVDGVTHALTIDDAGKAFEVKVGQKISVALSGVPTAGYVWGASTPPAWVKASDGPGGATSSAQFLPGFAGGNHWEVVIIEAVAAGEGEITLAQRRPWENTAEADATTFKFKLKAS
jgi:predicted secreted protein